MLLGQNKNNAIINGRFDYWQRGTSFSTPSPNVYTADRFRTFYDGTIGTFSVSRQAFAAGQVEVPNDPKYFLRWNQTVAGSGSTSRRIQHPIEGVSTFQGGKATVAFWMKADSARNTDVRFVQTFGSGGSAATFTAFQQVSLTTSWQKFELTFDLPSTSGKTIGSNDALLLEFHLPINTTMTIDLANVQAVKGSEVGNFEIAGNTLPGELTLCQRYYEVPGETLSTSGNSQATFQHVNSSGNFQETVFFKVTKRTIPTVRVWSPDTGAEGRIRVSSTDVVASAVFTNTNKFSLTVSAVPASSQVKYLWETDAEL